MADAYKTEKAFMLENMKHSKRRAEGEYKDLSQKLRGENQNLKNQLKKESQKNIEMVAQLQNELDRKTKQCENYHSELTEINEGLEAREAYDHPNIHIYISFLLWVVVFKIGA